MAFDAKYDGTCDECNGRFHAGDQIERAPASPLGDEQSRYRHERCPDDPSVSLRPGETVCESCFMVKPCPCEDGL